MNYISRHHYRFEEKNKISQSLKQKDMETKRVYSYRPTFSSAYGTGWKTMADNFLRLLLVVLVLVIVNSPLAGDRASFKFDMHDLGGFPFNRFDLFTYGALGVAAVFLFLLAMLYVLLVQPVFRYGAKMMFVQSVRQVTPEFDMLIAGFRRSYLNIVLANLLLFALIGIGFLFFLIPGIIMACRLAFTPYLVMDRQLDPIRAVEESWRLTRGKGWTIFMMGIASFFIYIAGLICLIVGVLISSIWVKSSFAALYHSVLIEKGLWQAEAIPVSGGETPGGSPLTEQ